MQAKLKSIWTEEMFKKVGEFKIVVFMNNNDQFMFNRIELKRKQ